MKIACLSDTHLKHKDVETYGIPEADVLIHAGDFSNRGTLREFQLFLSFLYNLPHKKIIFIAGNHDLIFEARRKEMRSLMNDLAVDTNYRIVYLDESGIEVDGLRFYGLPHQPRFHNWAFNRDPMGMEAVCSRIPENTDVLITHGPPREILDVPGHPHKHDELGNIRHCGCPILKRHIFERVKPKAHIFGHIHGSAGVETINGIEFVNAASLGEDYTTINPPITIEL